MSHPSEATKIHRQPAAPNYFNNLQFTFRVTLKLNHQCKCPKRGLFIKEITRSSKFPTTTRWHVTQTSILSWEYVTQLQSRISFPAPWRIVPQPKFGNFKSHIANRYANFMQLFSIVYYHPTNYVENKFACEKRVPTTVDVHHERQFGLIKSL